MPETEGQRFLIDHLSESARTFIEFVSSVDPARWSVRPAPDRWSVGEIAEHVLLIDSIVAGLSENLGELPEEPYDADKSARKDQLILSVAENRKALIEAPESVQPSGKFQSAEAFSTPFCEVQERIARVAAGNEDLLRGRFRMHPVLKKLDGYQWILVCSCHRLRHLEQAKEVIRALES